MLLERLMGAAGAAAFMQNYFLRLPHALPGVCRDITPLGSWEAVERILACSDVDRLAAREGRTWDGPLPTTLVDVRALLSDGYTLRVRNSERHHSGLADLAAQFHQDFQAPIDIQLYCTPAGRPGFGWHYDPEDVFVIQTHGSKEWQLRKNTVHPWPLIETLPADMRYEREIMPLWRCTLHEGDLLYIPNGYWHQTQAGQESISLSVGVLSPSAMDVFDFLRPYLLDSLRWRQRLPPLGAASSLTPEEKLRHCRELFAELGKDLVELLGRETTARSFVESRRNTR